MRSGGSVVSSQDLEGFDVFLSYASVDDQLPAPCDRWVSKFTNALRQVLSSKLGREPKIYFDRLCAAPNHELENILKSCRSSKIFVAIASPAYQVRDWTRSELESFMEAAESPRLFVVEFQPIPNHAHPLLVERSRIQFFRRGIYGEARMPAPLKPDSDEFFHKIWDLAYAIGDQLELMAGGEVAKPPAEEPKLGPVLLCMPTDDLEDECNAVRRHLEQVGAKVLPEAEYPLGGEAFKQAFAEGLDQCTLVVQLLGPKVGRHPPDLKEGYTCHQADATLAAGRPIMQWRSLSLKVNEVGDPVYRDLLRRDTVTASTLEQFKTSVRQRLTSPPAEIKADDKKADGGNAGIVVFVNAEKSDEPAAQRMKDALGEYSVFLPLFSADGSNQEDYREKLQGCDVMLLVYGEAGPIWVERQMLHAVKELRGALPHGGICFGPPPEKPHVNFSVPGFPEVDCRTEGGDGWRLEPIRELMARRRR